MERYSTSRVAQILDVSVATLNRWYKWYESDDYKKPVGLKLPQYIRDTRGTKLFTMEDIQALAAFKVALQNEYRGCMAEFNAVYQWGQEKGGRKCQEELISHKNRQFLKLLTSTKETRIWKTILKT